MSNEHPSIKAVSASIVIPTWRRHKSLRRVLDSIQLQSDHDFEVVVVCDGPDPDTEWLARTYTPAFPLRWKYHSENQGVGAARNTGSNSPRGH